jgi:hypothetical protein
VDAKNFALGAFVVLTLVFASAAAIEYSRGPSLSTITSTAFSTVTSTETTTTTSTTVSATSLVSISTVTASSTAAFNLSVRTDRAAYTTNEPIFVSGRVLPGPNASGSLANVTLIVTGPVGVIATATSRVSSFNGSYSYMLVAGGSSGWVVGVYTVSAICLAFGAAESATTQFTYAVPG